MYKNVGYAIDYNTLSCISKYNVKYLYIEHQNLPCENVVVSHISKLGRLSCKKGLICIGQ